MGFVAHVGVTGWDAVQQQDLRAAIHRHLIVEECKHHIEGVLLIAVVALIDDHQVKVGDAHALLLQFMHKDGRHHEHGVVPLEELGPSHGLPLGVHHFALWHTPYGGRRGSTKAQPGPPALCWYTG